MRKINKIVVHCTDSPDDLDIGAGNIRQWHKERGWSDIGYHWVVRRSGKVEGGRNEKTPGAHVRGHNRMSIGVCWVGRKKPARKQYRALVDLVNRICGVYNLDASNVYGHSELNSGKTCPNIDMNEFRKDLLFPESALVDWSDT